jgi:hypothetical protein
LKTYICCSPNMHFSLRYTALSIYHSKLKVFLVSLLSDQCLISALVIKITREQHALVRTNFYKAITLPTNTCFVLKNCNFVDVNYLLNCFKIFYRNKVVFSTFCL